MKVRWIARGEAGTGDMQHTKKDGSCYETMNEMT